MNTAPPNRWVRHPAAGIARAVLATLLGLLVWSVLPVVLGWQPSVVVSGSMEPAIRTGDVVVTREVPAPVLRPGHVLLVEDPVRPGSRLLHRYDHEDDDGGLVLRGDANERADSTPVRSDDVIGVGVLRVPWVGLPYVWASQGNYLAVGLTAVALLALLALSPIRDRAGTVVVDGSDGEDTDDGPDGDDASDTAQPTSRTGGTDSRHAAVVAAGAVLLLVAGTAAGNLGTPASAAFMDTTTMSTTFTAGELPETPPTSTTPAPNAGTQTERTDSGGTPSHDLEADLDDSHDEEVSRADSEHAQVSDSVTTPASPTADDDECVTCSTEVERCDTSTATD